MNKSVLFAVILGVAPMSMSVAAQWTVVKPDSYIGFVATYDDIPFEARFESFAADIQFSPGNLENASFDVRIETGSLDSNSPDRDGGMKEPEWFATGKYPTARFAAERFEKTSGNGYTAVGELTVKDVTRTVDVPFIWEQSGNEATLDAETELKRGDFDIGTGEWAEDDIIGFKVIVKAHLILTQD